MYKVLNFLECKLVILKYKCDFFMYLVIQEYQVLYWAVDVT